MTLYTRPTSSRVWEEIEIDESTTINNNNIKICCCWVQFRQGFSKSKWRRKQAHRIGAPSANHDGESTAKTFLLLQEEHHHGVTFFDTVVIQSWAISWPTVYHPLWENCNECHTVADTQKKLQWEIKALKNCTLSWSKKLYMFLSRQVLRCLPPHKDEFCSTHRCTRTASLMDSEVQSR